MGRLGRAMGFDAAAAAVVVIVNGFAVEHGQLIMLGINIRRKMWGKGGRKTVVVVEDRHVSDEQRQKGSLGV